MVQVSVNNCCTAMATLSVHNVDLPFHAMRCVLEIIAVEGLVVVTKVLLSMNIRSMRGLEPVEELMGNRVAESLQTSSLLKGCNDACRPSVPEIIDGSDSRVEPSKKNVTSSEVGECKDAGSDDDDDDDDEDDEDEDQDEIGDEEDDLSAEEGGEDQNGEDEEDQEGGEAAANGNDEDDDDDDEDGEEDEDDDEDEDDEEDEEDEDEEPPAKKKK